jgi:hypothetical protein
MGDGAPGVVEANHRYQRLIAALTGHCGVYSLIHFVLEGIQEKGTVWGS